MMVNQDLSLTGATLRGQINSYCDEVGRDMLRLYYGTGEDFKDLLDTKYPQFKTTYLDPSSVPPADDEFPISAGAQVIVDPPSIQGFRIGAFD